MAARRIETSDPALFERGCLLCSEDRPHRCHRRLVAEYLREKWGAVEIVHLPPVETGRRGAFPARQKPL
jgi:uncharacterized protein (DUF488 family)